MDSQLTTAVRRAWRRLLPFMAVLYVVKYLDRVNVGIATVEMNVDLGFSATAFGVGAGMLFAGYTRCSCSRCRPPTRSARHCPHCS